MWKCPIQSMFDWMVAIGLAVCALHVGRVRLGGLLLAYGALIRAFPVLALVGLADRMAHSVLKRGHDRVVEKTVAEFRNRLGAVG